MKLIHEDYAFKLKFEDEKVNSLHIDDPAQYTKLVYELFAQIKGKQGGYILSKKNEPVDINSNLELVVDYMSLDCNNKALLSKLYKEIEFNINEDYILEAKELESRIINYINNTISRTNLPLYVTDELVASDLFKLLKLNFDVDNTSILSLLVSYIEINKYFIPDKVFVLANIKKWLSRSELDLLYNEILLKKLDVICIESGSCEKNLESERLFIIDEDLCEIY